ncbi:hypothetical protein CSC82_19265 [Rhodobacteraceae bacterium 4F10]|nr:hypothetical protein CSC82_19265 [Rhodobacteraceae bacterium 4F10]
MTLEEGRHIEMSLTSLISLQADWERYLTIFDEKHEVQVELLSDTGWWRGSSLYLHRSGLYVLNEGQGGCVVFQASPPQILHGYSHLCNKTPIDTERSGLNFSSDGCTPSRHYTDLCFLGLFFEAQGAEDTLQFNWSDTQGEPLLPTPP